VWKKTKEVPKGRVFESGGWIVYVEAREGLGDLPTLPARARELTQLVPIEL
jgi:hypothetical protein